METPEFIKKIDWSLLRNQKTELINIIEELRGGNDERADLLEGILGIIDAVQDFAVDEAQIVKSVDVYDFEQEEEREAETVNQKFARESADNIFMELTESEWFHMDEQMSSKFIEDIMADDKHIAAIKVLIKNQILEDMGSRPAAFIYDDNNIPVYDANMREDYEFVATNYCREIWKSEQTRIAWVCKNCGGEHVQTKYWVDLNTNQIIGNVSDGEEQDNYCPDCDGHHGVEQKEIKGI